MSVDLERAALLLDIMEKVAKIGPMFTAISGEAGAELKAMNDEATKQQNERVKYEAEKAAKAKAEEDAKAKSHPDRIFPKDSGVQEDHDPPRVERRANP